MCHNRFNILINRICNFKCDGYYRLLNMLGALVTLVWLMSIISHVRLRMAIRKQGKSETETLEYKHLYIL